MRPPRLQTLMRMPKSFLLPLIFLLPPLARAGTEGHGGDGVVVEFLALAEHLPVLLRNWKEKPQDLVEENIRQTVERMNVESRDHLEIAGEVVDAANFPTERKIVVHRGRWKDLALPAK